MNYGYFAAKTDHFHLKQWFPDWMKFLKFLIQKHLIDIFTSSYLIIICLFRVCDASGAKAHVCSVNPTNLVFLRH